MQKLDRDAPYDDLELPASSKSEPLADARDLPKTSKATPPVVTGTLRTRSDTFDASVSRTKGVIISLHDDIVSMGLSLIRDLRCMGNQKLV